MCYGTALDPLLIFKGVNLQSTWSGKETLPETYFAVTENGWMATKVFHSWFKLFV